MANHYQQSFHRGYVSGALYLMNNVLSSFSKSKAGTINMWKLRVLYEYLGLCLCDYEVDQKSDFDMEKAQIEAANMYERFRP